MRPKSTPKQIKIAQQVHRLESLKYYIVKYNTDPEFREKEKMRQKLNYQKKCLKKNGTC